MQRVPLARGPRQLLRPELVQALGERNELRYAPRGVAAVIAPWNFPLAIPTGMTAAALATGNTVVLKPAEQAPGCGLRVVEALRAGGVPADAIALLPGEGDAGAALARNPAVATIAFTGSGPVGLELLQTAAQPKPGARQLTRVVAEMGGKNCIVVDSDADLDEAIPAIVSSAFDYAGQKCSAAARVLVHDALHDALVERLAGAVAGLQVGPADEFGTDVPPVIEQAAQERVQRYAASAAQAGEIVSGRPELQAGDGPRQPLDELVVHGLVDEHAGGRRALLSRVDERRSHDRRDRLVEVRVGVDDHAVLAAHLRHHALDVALAVRRLCGRPHDLEPDRAGAGEGDHVHARVANQRGADLAEAAQQRQGVLRYPGGV